MWTQNVELHLIALDLLPTIQESCSKRTTQGPQTEIDNSRAFTLMKRHMKMALQFEYMNEDTAKNPWVAPRKRSRSTME